jgi:hypothetical protein
MRPVVRLAFRTPFISCLLRLIVAAHAVPSRDISQVDPAQAGGLTLNLSALAMLAAREPLDGRARETMRAYAALLTVEAEAAEYLGIVGHAPDIISLGSHMTNLSTVVQQLEAERQRAKNELVRIDAALAALGSSSKRTITAASRRKMAAEQKARWAKVKRAS